jgi:hypothetical protein
LVLRRRDFIRVWCCISPTGFRPPLRALPGSTRSAISAVPRPFHCRLVRDRTGSFGAGLYSLAAFALMSAAISALWLDIRRPTVASAVIRTAANRKSRWLARHLPQLYCRQTIGRRAQEPDEGHRARELRVENPRNVAAVCRVPRDVGDSDERSRGRIIDRAYVRGRGCRILPVVGDLWIFHSLQPVEGVPS